MYRHVIWDVGGTLFDTYPAVNAAMVRAIRSLGGRALPDRVAELTHVSTGHALRTLAGESDLDEATLKDAYEREYDTASPLEQVPFPGARELCEHVVQTGGKNVIASHRSHLSIDALLAAHELAHLFAGAVTPEDAFPRKPDPALIREALESFRLGPRETLVVGDRDIDVIAADRAGVDACAFGNGVTVHAKHRTLTHHETLEIVRGGSDPSDV
jgi:HAD superfamily hydrolase (TIGR01549 family)